ncbi:MAG: hypothetical protein WDN67_04240 [Candidatus Moraniibacteriota bacterium]
MTALYILLAIGGIGFTYYKYVIERNYVVKLQTPCDPTTEICYVSYCDPEAEDAECTGNAEEDTTYYKILYRKAVNIPACEPALEGDCDKVYTCSEEEDACELISCDPSALEEGGGMQ